MHLHINLSKLYLMLGNIEIHFKIPQLKMLSFILHIFTHLGIFC